VQFADEVHDRVAQRVASRGFRDRRDERRDDIAAQFIGPTTDRNFDGVGLLHDGAFDVGRGDAVPRREDHVVVARGEEEVLTVGLTKQHPSIHLRMNDAIDLIRFAQVAVIGAVERRLGGHVTINSTHVILLDPCEHFSSLVFDDTVTSSVIPPTRV
jgi:hypothetical protein